MWIKPAAGIQHRLGGEPDSRCDIQYLGRQAPRTAAGALRRVACYHPAARAVRAFGALGAS